MAQSALIFLGVLILVLELVPGIAWLRQIILGHSDLFFIIFTTLDLSKALYVCLTISYWFTEIISISVEFKSIQKVVILIFQFVQFTASFAVTFIIIEELLKNKQRNDLAVIYSLMIGFYSLIKVALQFSYTYLLFELINLPNFPPEIKTQKEFQYFYIQNNTSDQKK